MDHRALGHSLRTEDVEQVIEGVARVNHEGQVELLGEGDLASEGLTLDITRRVLVVVVETAFADADQFWVPGARQFLNGGEVARGVVRVQAHRGVNLHRTGQFRDGERLT